MNDTQEKSLSIRLYNKVYLEAAEHSKNARYESFSHYVRCAIMKLNREERKFITTLETTEKESLQRLKN